MEFVQYFSRSSYSTSFIIAAALHAIILFAGGWFLAKNVEYGMEIGRSNVEVDLVAAPPDEQSAPVQPQTEAQPEITPVINLPDPNDFILPEKVQEQPKPVIESKPIEEKPKPIVAEKPKTIIKNIESTPYKGDGSSVKQGKDATSFHSTGGAIAEAKPDYLKNPPPAYPSNARRLRQEGLVLLSVEVNSDGQPTSVNLKESSGFKLLDDAALKAVQRWKFSPAKLGMVSVASRVDVPIRFQLKDPNF